MYRKMFMQCEFNNTTIFLTSHPSEVFILFLSFLKFKSGRGLWRIYDIILEKRINLGYEKDKKDNFS